MEAPPFESLLQKNTTLELLRAHQAPLILSFLWQAYRSTGEVTRSQLWMQQNLADYLEHNGEIKEEEQSEDTARRYLNSWCDRSFLRNYMDDQRKEMLYVLTRHTEKAFQLIDLLQEREFVGTESRFRDILAKLKEIVSYGQMDAQSRIRELQAQRAEIDAQIELLQRGGQGVVFEDYQIRSRYEEVLRMIRELTGDFREVEDNFRHLTRQIYEQHAQGTFSSGNILRFTFDALDELRHSDQGKSFYTFWTFLNDSDSNEELRRITGQVHNILQDRDLPFSENALRYLKRMLYNAGHRVVNSNEQLAQKLAQVVAEKEIASRKYTLELMRTIRQQALKLVGKEPSQGVGLAVDVLSELHLPLERKLQIKQEHRSFQSESVAIAAQDLQLEDIRHFYNPWLVDRQLLRQRLATLLEHQGQISLPGILEHYPIEKGLPELLAWISLMQSEPHVLQPEHQDTLAFSDNRALKLPRLIFVKGIHDGSPLG